MKIAIYARVSTKDKGQDYENQLRNLKEFAANWKYEVVGEYIDTASASGKVIRPKFVEMMDHARKRKFDLILFWSLDRLSREGVSETLDYLKNLTNWGVGWKSFTEQYLDSTGIFKEAVIAIIATIAKQERVRISERVKAGLETARLHGTKSGNSIGRQKKIFRRDIAIEMRQEGKSVREIAKELGVCSSIVHRELAGVPKPLPLTVPLPLDSVAA